MWWCEVTLLADPLLVRSQLKDSEWEQSIWEFHSCRCIRAEKWWAPSPSRSYDAVSPHSSRNLLKLTEILQLTNKLFSVIQYKNFSNFISASIHVSKREPQFQGLINIVQLFEKSSKILFRRMKIVWLLSAVSALYFEISEKDKKCFIEELPEDTQMTGKYLVQIFDKATKVMRRFHCW